MKPNDAPTRKRTAAHRLAPLLAVLFLLPAACAHNGGGGSFEAGAQYTTVLGPPAGESPAAEGDEAFFAEFDEPQADSRGGDLVADPIAGWNRAMFHFNDRLYFWMLKPLALGYKTVTAEGMRVGVSNFFHNAAAPVRFVNCLLQGKFREGGAELARFLMNTTVGVLGFGDPAAGYEGLNPPEEDLGQTLGAYGIDNGFYIVWPFLGPSTLRDSVGRLGDAFLDPFSLIDVSAATLAGRGLRTINSTSFRIGDYEALKDAALEPYEAFRDGYIQFRLNRVQE